MTHGARGRSVVSARRVARILLRGWDRFARYLGRYQSDLLLSLVYFAVLGPSSLIARATGSRLLDADPRAAGGWSVREARDASLDAQRMQF